MKNQKTITKFLLLGCFLFNISRLTAQAQTASSTEPPKRIKVGVALSGGGARGLAHIGVLEWFEQNRIPVDVLGGTSMGGLIGGLYAMGWTPEEMRVFIKTINWEETFGSGVPFQDLSFRRKQDQREYPVDLELGLKHGLSLPPGISNGLKVGLIIDEVTLPYSTVSNFNDLPIPFICMGTDILKAQSVIMNSGLLSSALRVTMSLPAIFPPVYRDGMWLVDGGVLDNIPVDVLRNMGPDVVIAVNVGTPLGGEKAIQSIFGVAGQAIGVMMAGNEERNLKLADIVISPPLGEMSNLDFSNVDKTANLGFPAAEEKAAELRKYALSESDWQAYLAERNSRKRTTLPTPSSVQVTGVNTDAQEAIQNQFAGVVSQPLDQKLLQRDLTRLVGEGRYQAADYNFVQDSSTSEALQLRVTEKTYAPPTLNFRLSIEGSDISELNFGIGTRLTLYDIEKYGSEWRNDLNLGVNSSIESEFYRPFGTRGAMARLGLFQSGFFAAPRVFYERGKRDFFSGGQRVAEYEVNNIGFGFDVGLDTWRTELRFGGAIEDVDANLSTGVAPIDHLQGRVDFLRLRFAFDGANSATIPTKGSRFTSELRYYYNSPESAEQFPWLLANGSAFKPVGKHGTLFAAGQLGSTFSKEAAPAQKFFLGGPFRLGAYDQGEFIGNQMILISAGYYHSIYTLPPLIGRNIWVTGWYDFGGAFDEWSDATYNNEANIGLMMDTRLGPFALIAAFGEGGAFNMYFSFGTFF